MNLRHYPILLFVLLFLPGLTYAVDPQDIDAANQANNTAFTLQFIIGQPKTIQIHIANPGANTFWGFGSVNFPGCGPAGGEIYTCQGITLRLPANSTTTPVSPTLPATVEWTGASPPLGVVNFTLIIGDGTFSRTYTLEFRQPLDVFFVLDKSGSMGTVTSGTTTRMSAMKTAVNGFLGKLSDPAFAGSTDRIGLNFFDTGVTLPAGAAMLPLTPATATTLNTAINPVSPSGSTAMGAGVNDAKSKLTDATHTRDMIVFTDGEQNVAPLVSNDGQNVGGVNINPSYPAPANSIRLFTIGIGSPSSTYLNTLKNMASANRGQCLLTSNGIDFTNSDGVPIGNIDAVFTQTFINLLHDASPQLVKFTSGPIVSGQQLIDFPLNRNVEDLVIEIKLNKSFEIPSLAPILGSIRVSRNGTDVTGLATPRWVGNYLNTYWLSFSFNSERARAANLQSDGTWQVSAIPNSAAQGLTYRLAVIADDHLLDYTCTQSLLRPKVNDTQHFSVKLSYLGKPIQNATVTATVYRPKEEIGDLIARNPLKVRAPRINPDRSALGILKYQTLLLRDPNFVKALTPIETEVPMTHQSNGQYEADFSGLSVAGIYQVLFRIRGTDSLSGTYDRVEMQSMYVEPAPIDPARSTVVRKTVNGILTVTMKPVTTTGKLVSAAADAFNVNAPQARLNSILDNQDGSYTLTFSGNIKSVGTIHLFNQKLFSGRIDAIKLTNVDVIRQPDTRLDPTTPVRRVTPVRRNPVRITNPQTPIRRNP
ncbi:VWA domain-containing protein [Spirosoma sp. BT702]|uniref:VWA domain-containing protein n=1 Tax=Spirosoma profusum TaxID=2771354 RepID=A0A926Y2G1_9BACT|nr:vWA domain-containing protein [Spirosoma profusum]MBD2700761.1 VWA domain-containing protein [Spirosoma profusum]